MTFFRCIFGCVRTHTLFLFSECTRLLHSLVILDYINATIIVATTVPPAQVWMIISFFNDNLHGLFALFFLHIFYYVVISPHVLCNMLLLLNRCLCVCGNYWCGIRHSRFSFRFISCKLFFSVYFLLVHCFNSFSFLFPSFHSYGCFTCSALGARLANATRKCRKLSLSLKLSTPSSSGGIICISRFV